MAPKVLFDLQLDSRQSILVPSDERHDTSPWITTMQSTSRRECQTRPWVVVSAHYCNHRLNWLWMNNIIDAIPANVCSLSFVLTWHKISASSSRRRRGGSSCLVKNPGEISSLPLALTLAKISMSSSGVMTCADGCEH